MTRANSFRRNLDVIPESSVLMEYNKRGLLIEKKWVLNDSPTPYSFSFEYDIAGNMSNMTYPNNTDIFYEHDELNRLVNIPEFFENWDFY